MKVKLCIINVRQRQKATSLGNYSNVGSVEQEQH